MSNPFLEQENYGAGYEESIKKMQKETSRPVELDRLCYAVFATPDGRILLEALKERFLFPGFVNPKGANAGNEALYFEGFKEAIRMLCNHVTAHEQRIKAEEARQHEST
jgi:hypothetical protein